MLQHTSQHAVTQSFSSNSFFGEKLCHVCFWKKTLGKQSDFLAHFFFSLRNLSLHEIELICPCCPSPAVAIETAVLFWSVCICSRINGLSAVRSMFLKEWSSCYWLPPLWRHRKMQLFRPTGLLQSSLLLVEFGLYFYVESIMLNLPSLVSLNLGVRKV